MWLVVGGKVTQALVKVLTEYTGEVFQGVSQVLDVAETVLKKGSQHFNDVQGIIVLSEGCHSVVDVSWMSTLNVLNTPVVYYSTYEGAHPKIEGTGLHNVRVKEINNSKLNVKVIAQDIEAIKLEGHSQPITQLLQAEGV